MDHLELTSTGGHAPGDAGARLQTGRSGGRLAHGHQRHRVCYARDRLNLEHLHCSRLLTGTTPHRRSLLDGLRRAFISLAGAGCVTLWLNGSFVTDKARPDDFDACWDPDGMDPDAIDPVLLDLAHPRTAQRTATAARCSPNVEELASGSLFVDFFQTDRDTGLPKGIIVLDLRSVAS